MLLKSAESGELGKRFFCDSEILFHLVQKDKDIVSNCRFRIFGSWRGLKEADCSRDFTPKSLQVRKCITEQMIRERNQDFEFDDGDDGDTSTQLFLNCMDQIL